jgi:hypothetical protein
MNCPPLTSRGDLDVRHGGVAPTLQEAPIVAIAARRP